MYNAVELVSSFMFHASLRRMRKYLTTDNAKLLYNAVINSQFYYASIVWMLCHKQDYLKFEKIQYKALKILRNKKCQFIKSSYVYWLLRFLKA